MKVIKNVCLVVVFAQCSTVYSQDYFNPMFLGNDVASLEDLSYLSEGNVISPGTYVFDLYLGDTFIKNVNIKFYANKLTKKVEPCLTKSMVDLIPLANEVKKNINSQTLQSSECLDIHTFIPEFNYEIDLSKSALTLVIPQIYLSSVRSTLANTDDWDDGISAFLMNYDYSGSNSKNKNSEDYSSNYLRINNRVNWGPWRLTGNVYWNQNKYGSQTYNETDTSDVALYRNINAIKSSLTIGQSSIGSSLFDSIPYIGATLATSNEMLPDSERGYSPPIRGIAETRSKLTIRQNGSIIYQTYVDPGPYDIKDLNPVGTSGDYDVELVAADGRISTYSVPYSSIPNLLKGGNFNYSATIGQLDIKSSKRSKFIQGTVAVGLPYKSTVYGGTQLSSDYNAAGLGLGRDFGEFGALSVDMVNAASKLDHKTENGQSYRVLYAKSFVSTGTNLQLTGYRYSTSGYYTFSEAARKNSTNKYYDPLLGDYRYYELDGRRKNTFQINANQSLGKYGQFYIWGNTSSYWGGASSKSIQVGWNRTFTSLNNLTVSLNYNKYTYNSSTNNIFYLSFNMPLGGRGSSTYISNSTNYNTSDHTYTNNTSIYGNALDNRLDYNVYQSFNTESSSNTSNANASYKTDYAQLKLGSSYSSRTTQVDYGVSGSVMLHKDGVFLTRELNDTAILVEAKGAEGAKINRAGDNVQINKQGYALIPYATPYHYNDVELDPTSFKNGYDIDNKVVKVAPTRGAISRVVFDVRQGYNFLVFVKHNNQKIRFGTLVKNATNNVTSIANDDGTVYLTGVENNAKFIAKWSKDQTCSFTVNYGKNFDPTLINKVEVDCL